MQDQRQVVHGHGGGGWKKKGRGSKENDLRSVSRLESSAFCLVARLLYVLKGRWTGAMANCVWSLSASFRVGKVET